MPLVVIRTTPILREIERVDRAVEEGLADVVHRLCKGVGDAHAAPVRGPADERQAQRMRLGTADGRVLIVVGEGRIRPAAVVVPYRRAARHVLVLSLIHISEPTRLLSISYAVFCLK